MPKRKQPPCLIGLVAKKVSITLQDTCRRIDSTPIKDECTEIQQKLENFAIDLPGPTLEWVFNEVISSLVERLQQNKNEKGLAAALNGLLQPNLSVVDLGSMFFKVRLSRDLSKLCASLLPSRLARMPLLTRLNLCSRCDDTVLQVISTNCPLLNYLNISFSDLVTDEGLLNLAGNGEDKGCLKLQYLGIMKLWDVTVAGVATVIKDLPVLSILQYDRCGDMLEQLSSTQLVLPLTNFDQSYYIYNPTFEQVTHISTMCPDIVSINIYVADQSLPFFAALKKVQKVDVELDGAGGSGLESWICCAGPRLTTLNLTFESLTWKQLEMICKNCPSLLRMRLLGSELVWDEGAEISARFPAVEQLRISIWGDKGISATLLTWVLDSAASRLTVLCVDAVTAFLNDQYLSALLATHPMPCLEELTLKGAPKGHLSFTAAELMINMCPELRKLDLSGCLTKASDRHRLREEMKVNNYDLELV